MRLALLAATVAVVHLRPALVTFADGATQAPQVWVPVVLPVVLAAGLAAVHATRHRPEPDIHDHHTDVLVALGLGSLGVAIPALIGDRLEDVLWTLRLDLVGLPLVVAAAIALLFGTRRLWRVRWPIAVLAGIGPLLAAGAIGGTPAVAVAGATLTLLTVLGAARRLRHPTGNGPSGGLPPLRGTIALLGVLCAAALATHAADDQGEPPATRPVASIRLDRALPARWAITETRTPALPAVLDDLRVSRAVLRGPDLADGVGGVRQAVVDRVRSDARLRLAALPVGALYDVRGSRAPGGGAVQLGGGVVGHSEAWQNPETRLTFTFVDFTVRPAGGGYERILVIVTDERRFDPTIFPPVDAAGAAAIGRSLKALIRGTSDELVRGRVLELKNVDVALRLARSIVREARA